MAFLGNPEFGVEFTPIDFARFAEACGGKGYSIREPGEVSSVMHEAMTERKKPTIIEAYVDPFDPPMPPKVEIEFVRKLAESFAKGQPYATRIGLTLYRNQVHERLRDFHHHDQIDHHDHHHQQK
jgi:pyruvate dehydrogenase (quinone)